MTTASPLIARGRTAPPPLKTRKLDGLPTWPLTLIAGREGTGKSYSAIEAALSPMIGHTFIVEIGETSMDPYGALLDPEHHDLLEHEGTYADIAGQIWAAVEAPRVDPDKPNLFVFDGASGLWDLVVNELQIIANARARRSNKRVGEDGQADITPDLWNAGKKKWAAIVDLLKSHDGPVIITGRLNEVAIFDGPAPRRDGAKEWKVEAHKSLPFDVDVVLQAKEVRDWKATKVRSLKFQLQPGQERAIPDFTFDKLWRAMGLVEGIKTGRRQFVAQNADAGAAEAIASENGSLTPDQWKAQIDGAEVPQTLWALHARAKQAEQLNLPIEGVTLDAYMRTRADVLKKAEAGDQAAVNQAAAEKRAERAEPTGAGAVVAAAQKAAQKRLPTPDQAANVEELVAPVTEAIAAQVDDDQAAVEALVAEAEHRGMLVDELNMIAEILGFTVEKITARTLPEGPEEAEIGKLQKVVANLRPMTSKKLRQAGRVGEATTYEQVGPEDFGPLSHLVGEQSPLVAGTADKAA